MQGVTPLLLLRASCAAGNGRFRNFHLLTHMCPCGYDLFSKVKESLRGPLYNTRDELIRTIRWSIRNIKKMVYDDFQTFWKCGWVYWRYISVELLWIKHVRNIKLLPLFFYPTLVKQSNRLLNLNIVSKLQELRKN